MRTIKQLTDEIKKLIPLGIIEKRKIFLLLDEIVETNNLQIENLSMNIDALGRSHDRKMKQIVERLEEYQQEYSSGDGEFTDELVDRVLRNAIELVKAGGVDDTQN